MNQPVDLERFPAAEPLHGGWAQSIRHNAAITVANDLLAKRGRHERLTEVRGRDDMHLAACA